MRREMIYDAPTIEIVECTVERGFSDSDFTDGVDVPNFDNENTI